MPSSRHRRDSASVALDFRARLMIMLVNRMINPHILSFTASGVFFWLGGSGRLRGDVVSAHANNVSALV